MGSTKRAIIRMGRSGVGMSDMIRLDLGAGARTREGFECVDLLTGPYRIDLLNGQHWPWADSSVEELYSSHFIEHIAADDVEYPYYDGIAVNVRKQDRLFWFFDECFRVLKPGGVFTLVWPALQHPNAFRDPTHRRFLPLEFTYYLSKKSRETMCVGHYNAECDFETLKAELHLDPERGSAEDWNIRTSWGAVMEYQVALVSQKGHELASELEKQLGLPLGQPTPEGEPEH
jgi:hypothetical protein